MGWLRYWAKEILRRAGWIVTKTPEPGSLPRRLRDLFAALDVTCVIDVGANKGQYARMLRDEAGFTGRIASVEPARATFRRLAETMSGDPNWAGFPFALGEEEAEATLRVASADEWNSVHELNAYAADRFGTTEIGTEQIAVRRLDSVFDELVAHHERVFLKVDTQGHDLAVVEGLGSRAVLGIQVELSFIPVYEGTPGFAEVMEALASRGYLPAAFFPVSWAEDGLCLVEADGVFVRADHDNLRPALAE
jgi:FkbM family methyltransferase